MQYSLNYSEAKNSLTNFNQIYFMLTNNAAALRILMNDDLYLSTDDILSNIEPITQLSAEATISDDNKIFVEKFDFLGKNLKNFLVLTNEPLQENHLKALENTLTRKQMALEDIAAVNFSAYNGITFKQLNASFMPQKMVCFGLKPAVLGLPEINLNQIINYADCQILCTSSFNEMLGNKEKTKAFWESMKVL